MTGWLCRRCAPPDPDQPPVHTACDLLRGCECLFLRWDDDRRVFVLCTALLPPTAGRPTVPYLYDHQNPNAPRRANGKRFWGYPTRSAGVAVVVVHTTESTFDEVGEDTGAEGVARYQASTDRRSSYHQIVDRDSTVVMLPDEATSFGVVGYNSRALNVSLAMRAADWTDPIKAAAAEPMLARAAAVVGDWCRRHDVPVERLTKAQVDAGRRGITGHGVLDPGRRSDPGAGFPWDRFLELVRGGTPAPPPAPAPPAPAPAPPPAPAPAPTPAPSPSGDEMDRLPVLRRGATGQAVRNLQGLLVAAGRRVAVDGDFGPVTETALRAWQAAAHAPGGVDGIAGPGTWGRLLGLR